MTEKTSIGEFIFSVVFRYFPVFWSISNTYKIIELSQVKLTLFYTIYKNISST